MTPVTSEDQPLPLKMELKEPLAGGGLAPFLFQIGGFTVLFISGVQQSDSVLHTHIFFFFRFLSHMGYHRASCVAFISPSAPVCPEQE